jgi:hypothetical protein
MKNVVSVVSEFLIIAFALDPLRIKKETMSAPQPSLLAQLGLDTLPKGEQDELNAEIGEVVFAGVMRRVWDVLDLHQQDALMSLLKESEQDPDLGVFVIGVEPE